MDSLGITYTLQSNASKQMFPNNNASQFIVQLPMEMNLTDDYAVALLEIHFSLAFKGVREKFNTSNNRVPRSPFLGGIISTHMLTSAAKELQRPLSIDRSRLLDETYMSSLTPEQLRILEREFNQLPSSELPVTDEQQIAQVKANIADKLNENQTKRGVEAVTMAHSSGGSHLKAEEAMQKHQHLIRAQQERIAEESRNAEFWRKSYMSFTQEMSKGAMNVNTAGIPRYLYVYCDVVKKRCLGDTYAHFLHVVRVPPIRVSGDTAMDRIHSPMYNRLERNTFNQIEIALRDERGQEVHFEDGAIVIVTLHFKRIH